MPGCFGFTDLSHLISETVSIFLVEVCLHYDSKAIALLWALSLCKLYQNQLVLII